MLGRIKGRLDDPLKFLQQLFALIRIEFDISTILRATNVSFEVHKRLTLKGDTVEQIKISNTKKMSIYILSTQAP